MRIDEVCLLLVEVEVEVECPAWEFEDRAVESLDLYVDHVRPTAGAGERAGPGVTES